MTDDRDARQQIQASRAGSGRHDTVADARLDCGTGRRPEAPAPDLLQFRLLVDAVATRAHRSVTTATPS